MAVFREFPIEWDGTTYTVVPSMRLMRAIESENISLMHVASQVSKGKPQASLMAFIIGTVMRSAGAKITDEELFAELTVGDAVAAYHLYEKVIEAISPTEPTSKKRAAPDARPQADKTTT